MSSGCPNRVPFCLLRARSSSNIGSDENVLYIAEYGLCGAAGGSIVSLDIKEGTLRQVFSGCRPTSWCFDASVSRLLVCDGGDMFDGFCSSDIIRGCNIIGISVACSTFGAVSPVALGHHVSGETLKSERADLHGRSLQTQSGIFMSGPHWIVFADAGNHRVVKVHLVSHQLPEVAWLGCRHGGRAAYQEGRLSLKVVC